MQNLLRTILTELENHKLMFRANAYELWNYGCEDMIVSWGYNQDKLIETLRDLKSILMMIQTNCMIRLMITWLREIT